MPNVPEYQQQVGVDAPGVGTPHVEAMGPAVSGAGLYEAAAGLGKTVEGAAGDIAHILVYKQRLDSQQKVDDLSSAASSEAQDFMRGKDGILTRQAEAANGITNQYDDFYGKLKDKYLEQVSGSYERKMLNHALDAHGRVMRNAVIEHEGSQARIGRQQSAEAATQAFKNTAVSAADAFDFESAMGDGMNKRESALRLEGHTDEQMISAVRMKTADEFTEAAVKANIEQNPEKAQKLLEAASGYISPSAKATLQDHIDGKMTSLRSDFINKEIIADPKSRNDDQSLSLGFVEQRAADMAANRPVGEQRKIVKMAVENAHMFNAALAEQKKKSEAEIADYFTVARDKGIPFGQAEKKFMDSNLSMFGQHEVEQMREQGVKTYQRDPDAVKNRLKTMNDDQQKGYAMAHDIITTKYAMKTKEVLDGEEYRMTPGRILLRQLDEIAPSKNSKQIMEWVNSQLKEVPTRPGYLAFLPGGPYFRGEQPRWEIQNKQEMGK